MTIDQLVQRLGDSPLPMAATLAAIPALAWLLTVLHGAGRGDLKPWRYLHAALLHLAVFPGVLALLLLGYQILVHPADLFSLDLLVYALPPACMAIALVGIRRATAFRNLPGAARLRGLVVTAAVSFAIALLMMKTRILLLFFGSIWMFVVTVAVLYMLLRGGLRAMAGGRRQ